MKSWRVCQCKPLCTVSIMYEGWLGHTPTIAAIMIWHKNVCQYIRTQHFFFFARHQRVCHRQYASPPSSGDWCNLNTVAAATMGYTTCPDGLNQWAPALVVCAASNCHQSQTNTVKRLFPFKCCHKKQKPNFCNWAKQGSSAAFMFIEPWWIHDLFGTISWLIKYVFVQNIQQ